MNEFNQLSEDDLAGYLFIIKALKGKSVIGDNEARTIESMTYGQVSLLKRYVSSGRDDLAVSMVFEMSEKKLSKTGVFNFFNAVFWVRNRLSDLLEKESKLLGSEPDQDLVLAGIEDLNRFGDQNIMIDLAERFNCMPEDIAQLKYSQVFTILWRDNILRKVNKTLSHIKKSKNG